MIRGFSFPLANPLKSYNLWTDLILPTVTDPTFGSTPFIPSQVSELRIYFPLTNANNVGQTLSVQVKGVEVKTLIPGDENVEVSMRNSIDVKGISLQGGAANVQVEFTLVSI